MLRVDNDPEICRWSGRLPDNFDQYNAVVISDYNKGFLDYEDIKYIAKTAKCPVFIDTKKTRLADIAPPCMTDRAEHVYIKINELEFKNTVTRSENLIVTLGDRGAQYKGKLYPTNPVEVMDVCGAGDTFLAALTAQYLFTKNIEQSIIFANIAAGLTVQHRGNYAPTYNEINCARY
jgi:D-beta-D-heptose 7-phosphate kinase/D-beta-D-heptose 1-phosphate adenosyltransferase